MEIKIKIDAPGLEGAIHTLAQVLAGMELPQTQSTIEVDKPVKEESKKETPAEEPKDTPPVEDKKETNTISLETVRVKLTELAQSGKQKEVKALITSLGAAKLSDVPEEKYPELLEKASEL